MPKDPWWWCGPIFRYFRIIIFWLGHFSVFRYFAISLFRYSAILLFRYFVISLFRYFAISLFRYFVISLFRRIPLASDKGDSVLTLDFYTQMNPPEAVANWFKIPLKDNLSNKTEEYVANGLSIFQTELFIWGFQRMSDNAAILFFWVSIKHNHFILSFSVLE